MSEQLPERQPSERRVIDVLLSTNNGPEIRTFDSAATIVRTFADEWQHMSYIAQIGDDPEVPRLLFGFQGLAQFLIAQGFREFHTEAPTEADQYWYIRYSQARIDHEL